MQTKKRDLGTTLALAAVALGMTVLWLAVSGDFGRITEKPKQEIQRIK